MVPLPPKYSPHAPESQRARAADDSGVRIVKTAPAPHIDGRREDDSVSDDGFDILPSSAGSLAHPTDARYQQDRRRYVNPADSAGMRLATIGANAVEKVVGERVFGIGAGILGAAKGRLDAWVEDWHESARNCPPPPLPPHNVMDIPGSRQRPRVYQKAEGKWHKPGELAGMGRRAPRVRKPLEGSGGLIEVSDYEDEESEGEWEDAVDRDFIDVGPGGIRDLSKAPFAEDARPLLKQPPKPRKPSKGKAKADHAEQPRPPRLDLATSDLFPAVPKDLEPIGPHRDSMRASAAYREHYNLQDHKDDITEGADSDFEDMVDYPLSPDSKARHQVKMARQRIAALEKLERHTQAAKRGVDGGRRGPTDDKIARHKRRTRDPEEMARRADQAYRIVEKYQGQGKSRRKFAFSEQVESREEDADMNAELEEWHGSSVHVESASPPMSPPPPRSSRRMTSPARMETKAKGRADKAKVFRSPRMGALDDVVEQPINERGQASFAQYAREKREERLRMTPTVAPKDISNDEGISTEGLNVLSDKMERVSLDD